MDLPGGAETESGGEFAGEEAGPDADRHIVAGDAAEEGVGETGEDKRKMVAEGFDKEEVSSWVEQAAKFL